MHKCPHIIESYACVLNICFYVFIIDKCSNLFWNIFYSKRIKISNVIILCIQSNPMSSNIGVLIKIYYICPMLYFLQIISWIYTIKSRFILIIFLYFKIKGWGGIKNPFCLDDLVFYFHNQVCFFLDLLKYLLIDLQLVYLVTY